MYILMLMNDFFKFRSATLLKDSFVKMVTNNTFNTKINKKNDMDIFLRNNGIAIEKAEVASTHEKIIFFRLSGLMD
jgi:rRNA pseudouridine-1189 N-methylase Emg1 (Nep1/Mra1 family)